MKFYADEVELRCGECSSPCSVRRMGNGNVRVRCLNRSCVAHGKNFIVQVATLEGVEEKPPLTADDVDQEPESASSVARRYSGREP